MSRLTVVALAGFLAAPVLAQDASHAIKLKKEAKGDRVKVASTDIGDMKFKLELMGREDVKEEKKTVKLAYTEEIVEKAKDARDATKLRRSYTTAERTTDGEKARLPYHGKAVVIEKKGDKYTFTVGGQELEEEDAEELEEEFNQGDIPLDNEDFLPAKPVKVGETWTVDAKKVAEAFDADGPLALDVKTTRIAGKLVKVYEKGGRRFGVMDLDLTLGVRELRVDGQEIAMKPGSTVRAKITLDACIDGTAHTGTEKGTMTFDLKGDIPNGSLTVTGTAKFDKSSEDLGAK
jgi:hypothetical protein